MGWLLELQSSLPKLHAGNRQKVKQSWVRLNNTQILAEQNFSNYSLLFFFPIDYKDSIFKRANFTTLPVNCISVHPDESFLNEQSTSSVNNQPCRPHSLVATGWRDWTWTLVIAMS